MCPDGVVYNIEVEENHNYFVNGVLVHNCHALVSNPQTRQMYAKVFARCKARYKYGLTATPRRQDGLTRLIYANIGMSPRGTFKPTHEVADSKTQSLVAKYETFDLFTRNSYSYLTEDGITDFNMLLNYLSEDRGRNLAIVGEVKRLVEKEGRKVAVLTYRAEHVNVLESMLRESGVNAMQIRGATNKKDRKFVLTQVDEWDVIVSTVHLFKEGLDIKSLDTIFIALPFKDPNAIQQSEGRAERPMEGKNEPLFVFAFDRNIPYCATVEKKMRTIVTRKRK